MTGATSGIGEALCYLLAKEKIDLIITGRDQEALLTLEKSLQTKVNVLSCQADLSKSSDRGKLLEFLEGRLPDLVINNAGLGLYGEAIKHSVHDEMNILEVNGNAVLEITLEVAKKWVEEKKEGVILNVSSIGAYHPFPYSAVYAASKAFVRSFSVGLDLELEKQGVRVLVACPGMVATNFSKRAAGKKHDSNAWLVMSPEYAAEAMWQQIQRRKSCYIFDWKYRLWAGLMPLIPERWVGAFVGRFIQQRL